MVLRISIFSLLLALPAQAVEDSKLEEVVLVSLSSVDGKAVVRLPKGKLQLLEIGSSISGTTAVVEEVLEDRLVLEERLEADSPDEPGEIRTVWLFKSKGLGQKSRLLVLHRTPPRRPAGEETGPEPRKAKSEVTRGVGPAKEQAQD